MIENVNKLLRATNKESVVKAKEIAHGYRLHPVDGVLEREVQTQKAVIWVPVLPDLALPSGKEKGKLWRRWAFER